MSRLAKRMDVTYLPSTAHENNCLIVLGALNVCNFSWIFFFTFPRSAVIVKYKSYVSGKSSCERTKILLRE